MLSFAAGWARLIGTVSCVAARTMGWMRISSSPAVGNVDAEGQVDGAAVQRRVSSHGNLEAVSRR